MADRPGRRSETSRVLRAELAPVAATVALVGVKDFLLQLYDLVEHLSLQQLRSRQSGDSGGFKAVRPRRISHASSRVLLAELAPV